MAPQSTRLEPDDYRALADFRYQLRRFLGFSEAAVRTAGLEPRQHQLLLAVRGMPEGRRASVGALAERLQLRHHSTVELLDRMEARDLVRRERAPDDRRQVIVQLTPLGIALLAQLSLLHRTELRVVGPALLRALRLLEPTTVAPAGGPRAPAARAPRAATHRRGR